MRRENSVINKSFRHISEGQKPWNLKLIQEACRDWRIGYISGCVAQVTLGAGVRGHGGDFETKYVLGCKLLQTGGQAQRRRWSR
jgi:hypothetical protein